MARWFVVLGALAASGCKPCESSKFWRDLDGDGRGWSADPITVCDGDAVPKGYARTDDDCDDGRPDVYAGAPELCDLIDNDCDDAVDEDENGPTWYPDGDGDGHGSPQGPVEACAQPTGFVASSDDCDDTTTFVHHGADEICDGLDNDCDGLLDDADPEVGPLPRWFRDQDGDSYGDLDGAALSRCVQPPGRVDNQLDCDDGDPDIHPAATEVCGADGDSGWSPSNDEDCDGLVDGADPSLDLSTASTWYDDGDNDGYGDPLSPTQGCNPPFAAIFTGDDCDDADPGVGPARPWLMDGDGDGYGGGAPTVACTAPAGGWVDELAPDCADADASRSPAAEEVCGDAVDQDCNGVDLDCARPLRADLDAGLALLGLHGELAGDLLGSVAVLGDVTGDLVADLAVAAPGSDLGGSGAGAVYLLHGPVDGADTLATADELVLGGVAGAGAGMQVLAAGDVSGDGLSDLIVGVPNDPVAQGGAIYVFHGPMAGAAAFTDADARVTLDGYYYYYYYGYSDIGEVMDVADLNGDSVNDLIFAMPGAYVYFAMGPLNGPINQYGAPGELHGWEGDFGRSVSGLGDTDGDGRSEVAVGAPLMRVGGLFDAGTAYVFEGPVNGHLHVNQSDLTVRGDRPGIQLGTVDGPGDVDGDGRADLVVAAPFDGLGGGDSGTIYLIDGTTRGATTAEAAFTARLIGESADERSGQTLAGGDVDGDGFGDLVVGARGLDGAGASRGVGYIVYGPITGTLDLAQADASVRGAAGGDGAGGVFLSAGDVTGDGPGDLLLGLPGSDDSGVDAGSVYLFDGAP